MKESLHYLLMSDHLMVQKALLNRIKDTGLTSGQPKILDYLMHHDGAIQKEIAVFCHIEPASLTVILNGMENKGYITRQRQPPRTACIPDALRQRICLPVTAGICRN